jgi:FAD/FMN-containing dehydrogenase
MRGVPLLDALRDAVGAANVLTDADVVAGYCVDWTGRFAGRTDAVVRPGSTDEVAAVLRACSEHGAAVVPQGGNTGLVGGSVPLHREIVLSLSRMRAVDDIDALAGQVTADAGATVAAVDAAAATLGLAYPVDLASRDSATVGGTIATNAAGLHALRYGDTRAQVVGLEAVFADGTVASHLGGLVRDNTGYHLPSLLCGSEGTLAVVTRARLRLVARPQARVVALLAFASTSDAVAAAADARRALPSLEAAELFLEPGLRLVCDHLGEPGPFASPAGAYRLLEAADRTDPTDALAETVANLAGVVDAAVASDPTPAARLWSYRERHTEAINTLGPPHKLDVALPLAGLAAFVDAVPAVVTAIEPDARTWIFGHAADGNVHVNVSGLAPADERVDDAVLRLVAASGGSISAEHGIGSAKRAWLALSRSPAELAAFRALKRALDPLGILNPNVLLQEPPATDG